MKDGAPAEERDRTGTHEKDWCGFFLSHATRVQRARAT